MVTTKRLALAALLSVLVQPGMAQPAQPWPERIVRLITPAPAGGSPDVVGRLFAEKLAERWKAAVVIENRPGADGVIAMEAVLQAKDGHTLLIAQSGILTVTPALRKLPFDVRDLRPLSTAAVDFLALVVPASSSIHSVSNLVAVARERPGIVNWVAPTGAPVVVFQEFVRKNQIDAVYVPYKGGPEALRDLMEGRIHVSLVPLATALPLAESGKLRVIAITNPERAPSLPQVPTAAEAGFPELVLEGVLGSWRQYRSPMKFEAGSRPTFRPLQMIPLSEAISPRAAKSPGGARLPHTRRFLTSSARIGVSWWVRGT